VSLAEATRTAVPGRRIPFLDLRVHDPHENAELIQACANVLRHGHLINGPEVDMLEAAMAESHGRRYGVGVGSGTSALELALRALDIGPGDEVILPALSFVATANAVRLVGATPVFADIGDDLNIDPHRWQQNLTGSTQAIILVHWAGRRCNVSPILDSARSQRIYVIEDASQAIFAVGGGGGVGTFGDIACFSMNPMKAFAALGDAGMILTDDTQIRKRLLALRYNGMRDKEFCDEPCGNHRLDTLQAAFLLVRFRSLQNIINKRRKIAAYYDSRLQGVVDTPKERPGEYLTYYTYTIQTDRRDELKAHLENHGVECKIQHALLMPEQPAYAPTARGKWDNAKRLMQRVLCIPCHEKMTMEDAGYVADRIAEVC